MLQEIHLFQENWQQLMKTEGVLKGVQHSISKAVDVGTFLA